MGALTDECRASVLGEHLWEIDKDDRRFKYCIWCLLYKFRSDTELLEDLAKQKQEQEEENG